MILCLLLVAQAAAHGTRSGWVKPPTPEGVTSLNYEYEVDGASYTGYLSFKTGQDSATPPGPGILLAHQWYGLGDMEKYRCEEIVTTLGFPCFALDVYGTGVRSPLRNDYQKVSERES
jgi:dienelactone hydrolase